MVTSPVRSVALGLDLITFNFLYTEQAPAVARSQAAPRELLSRGDRAVPAGGGERADGAWSSAANRWEDASRRRSRQPIPSSSSTGWCCSAIRCIRPDDRPNGVTRICRRSAGRCCSCRAAATRSARRASSRQCWRLSHRPRRFTSSKAATTRSRSGTRDPARQAAVYEDVQQTIIEWITTTGQVGNSVSWSSANCRTKYRVVTKSLGLSLTRGCRHRGSRAAGRRSAPPPRSARRTDRD